MLVSVAISRLALFVVPTPDGPDAHFRLSDFEGEPVDVEQLAPWVEAGDNHRIKKQLKALEDEHAELYKVYRAMPTEMMWTRCLKGIERKEREIGELKMNGIDEMAESLAFLPPAHGRDVFPGVMT